MVMWSWVLAAVGVTGLYLAGRRIWWAWLIGLAAQVLWIAYAIATAQYGFLVSATAYGAVYLRNAVLWRRETVSTDRFDNASISLTRIGFLRRVHGRSYSASGASTSAEASPSSPRTPRSGR